MKKITPEDFPFKNKIEEMTAEEIKQRTEKAINWEMDKITLLPYIGEVKEEVTYKYPELTSLCPFTGIPDFYEVKIIFTPDKYIPELKSLRFYLIGFRNLPISHEHLHAKIFNEFKQQVKPKKLRIDLSVAVRGGIKTDITSEM